MDNVYSYGGPRLSKRSVIGEKQTNKNIAKKTLPDDKVKKFYNSLHQRPQSN